jgi:hypothetical protein
MGFILVGFRLRIRIYIGTVHSETYVCAEDKILLRPGS